jgi:hypothetical protein
MYEVHIHFMLNQYYASQGQDSLVVFVIGQASTKPDRAVGPVRKTYAHGNTKK